MTPEEKKEKKRLADKRYYEKNKEKIKERDKHYYENNKTGSAGHDSRAWPHFGKDRWDWGR